MLVQTFFTLAGIVAVGMMVGYVVTPVIFYLMEVMAYVAALFVNVQIRKRYTRQQLRGIPKWNDLPESISRPLSSHSRNDKNQRVKYPQPTRDSRKGAISRDSITEVNRKHTANNSDKGDNCPAENDVLDMVSRPAIEKVSQPIHNLLSFYRRFYGQSTKVEKNPLT